MKKIILKSMQSLGDVVMMTGALRDLHRLYPGEYMTDVRVAECLAPLFDNNPFVYPVADNDPEAETIEIGYPLIHLSNQTPWHFLHAMGQDLAAKLGLSAIPPTAFRGDIYMRWTERQMPDGLNYWLIVAGGKQDFTIKHWSCDRWQAVVDHFRGRIQFVQVGHSGHVHAPLDGVIDLRGKTSTRDLIKLVHHCQGIVCPVTGLMHLAAAVPIKDGLPPMRPCVVVAGGRESPTWEMYPNHQFLHNVGALPCCAWGGCWRSRTVPLGDGDEKDKPEALCQDVVEQHHTTNEGGRIDGTFSIPRCMDMIAPEDVCRAIETYFDGGMCEYLESVVWQESPANYFINSKGDRELLPKHEDYSG